MRALALLGLSSCATVANTCPVESRPGGGKAQGAAWCQATDAAATAVPTSGRGFEQKLGTIVKPGSMPGGIVGPFTRWHGNGAVAARGAYITEGARSLPDGVWMFWEPDGAPRMIGRYRRGEPVGCFAVWDRGTRNVGVIDGEALRLERCAPPEVPRVEEAPVAPRFDIQLQGMLGPNHLGIANPMLVTADPTMPAALGLSVRRYLGRLRVGGVAGARFANDSGYLALAAGATVGWELPRLHPRIGAEISGELAVQRLRASDVKRSGEPGLASLSFIAPLPAVQLGLTFTLSPTMEAVLGVRVDGLPARDVERTVRYCELGCTAVTQTWAVGGLSYGALLGFRFLIE